jgi:hypothetical protein
VSARVARDAVETARALESLPRVAAAAHAGDLSDEQLGPVVRLADATTDAEWAERAPAIDPAELARRARCRATPSLEESRARRDARFVSMRWSRDGAMLHLRGALADVEGARVETTIKHLVEQMRPPAGQPWDPWERRAADALTSLCTPAGGATDADLGGGEHPHAPTMAARPLLQVPVPVEGPATVCGIPLPDARVEQLRANATIEPVLVDDDGMPIAFGRRFPGLSPKLARATLLRDGQCRCGQNCGYRHGLEVHHIVPRSWGGTDDPANLVAVFAGHHPDLVPHGPWALVGNPNRPDGLRRVRYDELTDDRARRYGLPPPPGRRR